MSAVVPEKYNEFVEAYLKKHLPEVNVSEVDVPEVNMKVSAAHGRVSEGRCRECIFLYHMSRVTAFCLSCCCKSF